MAKKPRLVGPEPPKTGADFDPKKDAFDALYGEDEPDASRISEDLDAATDKLAFARRVDINGFNLLHYFGSRDLDNDFETYPLVQRLLEIDPSLAQALDLRGRLPLREYADNMCNIGDNLDYAREAFTENPPRGLFCLDYILPAFPEAIFAAGFLKTLYLNRPYKTHHLLERLNKPSDNNDSDSDSSAESYDSQESRNEKAMIGMLKLAFPDGLHQIPGPETVQKTGNRAPIHIFCSYAYEPVFEGLFSMCFKPSMASIPDAAAKNLLPLHLVLKSPILCHPLNAGPIYGFCQMRELEQVIPLSVVKQLTLAHPEALTVPDEDGCLPIHLAVRHNNLELVKYLFEAKPETATILDNRERSPLRIACQHNCDLDLLYFLAGSNPVPPQWLEGLVDSADKEDTTVSAPKIVNISDQTAKTEGYTMVFATVDDKSSEPTRWGLELLKAWTVSKGGERAPYTYPQGHSPGSVYIDNESGKLSIGPRHINGHVLRVRVTAENVAGWTGTEFEIDQTAVDA